MATRSTIALEYADGTVDQVYCHFDGYLAHNGQLLLKHYQDPFKVQQVMDLGDLTRLGEDIDKSYFYGRGQGESDVSAIRFPSYDAFLADFHCEEFNYILRRDGHWYVNTQGLEFRRLDEALKQQVDSVS